MGRLCFSDGCEDSGPAATAHPSSSNMSTIHRGHTFQCVHINCKPRQCVGRMDGCTDHTNVWDHQHKVRQYVGVVPNMCCPSINTDRFSVAATFCCAVCCHQAWKRCIDTEEFAERQIETEYMEADNK